MPSYNKRVSLTESLLFDIEYFKGKFGSRTSYGEAFCENFGIFDDRILKLMTGNTHAIEYAKRYYIDRKIGNLKKIEGSNAEAIHLPVIPENMAPTIEFIKPSPPPLPEKEPTEQKKELNEFEVFVYSHCGKKASKQMKKRGCPAGCTHEFEPDCLAKTVIGEEEEVVEEDTIFPQSESVVVDNSEISSEQNSQMLRELAEEMDRILGK